MNLENGDMIILEDVKVSDMLDNISLDVNDDIIFFDILESGDLLDDTPALDKAFVEKYIKISNLVARLSEQMDDAKSIIKRFIEEHNLGSFESNGLAVKYSSATTTTTLDSAKLKSKYPDIAAECSKVSARKSSISLKEVE